MEHYVVEWNSHQNRLYVAVKVVRVFRKKGGLVEKKYKNMITTRSIDQTLPAALQKRQQRDALRTWAEIDKAVRTALKDIPKKKIEF